MIVKFLDTLTYKEVLWRVNQSGLAYTMELLGVILKESSI
jgi:hypothetical protein